LTNTAAVLQTHNFDFIIDKFCLHFDLSISCVCSWNAE